MTLTPAYSLPASRRPGRMRDRERITICDYSENCRVRASSREDGVLLALPAETMLFAAKQYQSLIENQILKE
jgi:hypothetical protein